MTLSKLSLRNARRQARDYLVYFVTVVMAAALVYAFNGLIFSQELLTLSSMLESLPFVIVLASVVVVLIIGWLVHYTIGFMLSKRGRELGTYILIGLEHKQVARLFFLENLFVGGIALMLGTLLGNLIFQALRAVMLALFNVPYTFGFTFSLKAVGLTVFYFALMYLLALLNSRKRIRGMNIRDLIYFDQNNEDGLLRKSRSRRRVFAAAVVLGVLGTLLLLLRSLPLGILGSLFVILFLYGFFISFSSGVPAYFDKHPGKKYSGHTLLVFRALSAKLASMGVVMATVSLLFTATLISEGSGLLFSALTQSRNEQTTCFDLFIGSAAREEAPLEAYLEQIDAGIPVQASLSYQIYQGENAQVTGFIKANAPYWDAFDYDCLMKAGDYAALRAMLGYPAASLEPGEYVIHCMPYLGGLMSGYSEPLTVGGDTLLPGGVYTEHFTQLLWDGNGRGFLLVVPDEAAAARPVSHSAYAAMTADPVDGARFQALCAIRDQRSEAVPGYDTILSKAVVAAENASISAIMVFPLFYLALVLTMVSATILTIQQLSETARCRQQFSLLYRLGMDRREMKRALRRQLAIFYTMPAIPPLFISVPFLLALGGAFDPGALSGPGQLLSIIGITLGLFFFIYLIYILMAYQGMKRNVLPE